MVVLSFYHMMGAGNCSQFHISTFEKVKSHISLYSLNHYLLVLKYPLAYHPSQNNSNNKNPCLFNSSIKHMFNRCITLLSRTAKLHFCRILVLTEICSFSSINIFVGSEEINMSTICPSVSNKV